jgi:hypothetical protein
MYDIECPISKNATLLWISYSEEGMVYTFDSEGILRTMNPFNKQWIPVFDFKYRYPDSY